MSTTKLNESYFYFRVAPLVAEPFHRAYRFGIFDPNEKIKRFLLPEEIFLYADLAFADSLLHNLQEVAMILGARKYVDRFVESKAALRNIQSFHNKVGLESVLSLLADNESPTDSAVVYENAILSLPKMGKLQSEVYSMFNEGYSLEQISAIMFKP